jgi:hypothetical protein
MRSAVRLLNLDVDLVSLGLVLGLHKGFHLVGRRVMAPERRQ